MRAYVDLNTSQIIQAAGVSSPLERISFKRSSTVTLEFQFVRNGVVTELAPDATGIFGLKPKARYDDNYVTAGLAWVKSGAGETALYSFDLGLINDELDAEFNVDGDPDNDVVSIEFMAELQWIAGGIPYKSQTLIVEIVNDVNRGGETMPDMPLAAIGVYLPQITRLVGGTEIDLDAVPTARLRTGYVIQLLIAAGSGWQWRVFILTAWPDAYLLLPTDVAPLDFDADSNARYWRGASTAPAAEEVIEVVASEALSAFDLVTAGGERADSSELTHLGHIAGMTREDVAEDFIASLVVLGEVTNPAWAWPSANARLYLNGTGLSTAPPVTGFVQVVGLTRNSQTIIIQLGLPVRL